MIKLPKAVDSLESQLKSISEIIATSKGVSTEINENALREILYLAPFTDLRLKKLVYFYLSLVVDSVPESILHITNLAFNDLADANPNIRKSILYFVSDLSLKSDTVIDLVHSVLLQCMQDHSPAIRASAIDGVIKVCLRANLEDWNKSSDGQTQLINRVKDILPIDSDPAVVVRCVDCLARCTNETEIVQSSASSLINKIGLLDNKSVESVIGIAIKVIRPGLHIEEAECLDLLNQLDPLRKDSLKTALIFNTLVLMLNISNKLESKDLCGHILSQTVETCIRYYSISQSYEEKYLLLNSIIIAMNLSDESKNATKQHFKMFTLLSADSLNVKIMKCNILCFILNQENAFHVFTNIKRHLTTNEPILSTYCFKVLYNLHKFLPDKCENVINCLLQSQIHFVTESAIVHYCDIVLKRACHNNDENLSVPDAIMCSLILSYPRVKSDRAKSCLFWLVSLCNNANSAKKLANYLKLDVPNIFAPQMSYNLKYSHLTTVIKLFVKYPNRYFTLLKNVLKTIFSMHENTPLKYKAMQYYELLKVDISQLNHFIIDSNLPRAQFKTKSYKTNLVNLRDLSILMK